MTGMDVYIRPLREEDALVSWRWRNDAAIWVFTGARPDCEITEAIELGWIRRAINEEGSKRFAICMSGTDEYIGNVQLTNITQDTAQFHIFIGNRSFWGRGLATQATKLLIKWARNTLQIKSIYLEVNRNNFAAIRAYEKSGFVPASVRADKVLKMEVFLVQ